MSQMPSCRFVLAAALGLTAVGLHVPSNASAAPIAIGVAKADVTPQHPVVLGGYGGRTSELEGIDTPLYARAMVIGDKQPVAIVVLDSCGVTLKIRNRVAAALEPHGIANDRLVVAATHTHNAPNLKGYANILWAGRLTPEQQQHVEQYTSFAIEKMVDAVVAASRSRSPLQLAFVTGKATFGGNRRVLTQGTWTGFGFQRNGPVDHRVPILVARDASGTVKAVWANYACHCTTAGSVNRVNGDWAGFANDAIERDFPDAVSLVTIGCGADVGPQPTGNLDFAESHGNQIATALKTALQGKQVELSAEPHVDSTLVKLPLAHAGDEQHAVRTREYWERELTSGDGFHRELAKSMLSHLKQTGDVPTHVDYPVTAWKFEDQLAIVFLPGEVVVDYSVRLGQELDWQRLWLTAWANDMPGYIPSRRLLLEGGYESDFSQVYYEQPTRYDPQVEETVVNAVKQVAGEFKPTSTQAASPYHRIETSVPSPVE